MENKLTKERLTRLKEITDAVLTAQEKERAEIGKELHDNLNQILGATKLYIELARKDKDRVKMCLGKASGYITNKHYWVARRKAQPRRGDSGKSIYGVDSRMAVDAHICARQSFQRYLFFAGEA